MKQRADCKSPVTINVLSNIKITLDGKSTLCIILGIALLVALVVLEVEPKALFELIRSSVEALIGS